MVVSDAKGFGVILQKPERQGRRLDALIEQRRAPRRKIRLHQISIRCVRPAGVVRERVRQAVLLDRNPRKLVENAVSFSSRETKNCTSLEPSASVQVTMTASLSMAADELSTSTDIRGELKTSYIFAASLYGLIWIQHESAIAPCFLDTPNDRREIGEGVVETGHPHERSRDGRVD